LDAFFHASDLRGDAPAPGTCNDRATAAKAVLR